jgi:hypothetical protein
VKLHGEMIFCGMFEPSRRLYEMAAPIKIPRRPLVAELSCNIGHAATVVSLSAGSNEVCVGSKLTINWGAEQQVFLALMPIDGWHTILVNAVESGTYTASSVASTAFVWSPSGFRLVAVEPQLSRKRRNVISTVT